MTNESEFPGNLSSDVDLETLVRLRDGTLEEGRAREVLARLAADPDVAAALADVDEADVILRQVREIGMPGDVSTAIQDRLRSEAERRARGDVEG